MSPIAFLMRTGSPVDKASFRYLAIALGLSRYLAAKAAAVGVSFFPITFTSPSAWPANVASPGLSVTGTFNVKSQPFAFPDVVWINACGLQGADMQKDIR